MNFCILSEDKLAMGNHAISLLESIKIDDTGRPILSPMWSDIADTFFYDTDIDRGCRDTFEVFFYSYTKPDIKAKEILKNTGLLKQRLLQCFANIRANEHFQKTYLAHPLFQNCFRKIKTMLLYKSNTKKVIENQIKFPIAFELHLSLKCQLRCSFCYNVGSWYYPDKDRVPLTLEGWRELLDEIKQQGVGYIYISGGLEPLMNKDTLDIIRYSDEIKLPVFLFTNLTAFDFDEKSLDVLTRCRAINISFRASEPTLHHKMTRMPESDFKRLISNTEKLVTYKKKHARSCHINGSYIITRHNVYNVIDMALLAKELEIDFLNLSCDNIQPEKSLLKKQSDLSSVLLDLLGMIENWNPNPVLTLNDYLRKRLLLAEGRNAHIYNYEMNFQEVNCYNHLLMPTINPFGKIYQCCLVANPKIATEHTLVGIAGYGDKLSTVFEHPKEEMFKIPKCSSCNPSQRNGLILLQKLKNDFEFGINLDQQPFSIPKTGELKGI